MTWTSTATILPRGWVWVAKAAGFGMTVTVLTLVAFLALPSPEASAAEGEVLILDSTVSGGASSLEATKAGELGFDVVVVDATQWGAMSTADFASYEAIILGDPNCGGGHDSTTGSVNQLQAAEDNATTWGDAVTGNVAVLGTDAAFHSGGQGGAEVTEGGINFATADADRTGAYITTSCYYDFADAGTPVPALDGLGTFTAVQVPGCFNDIAVVADDPELTGYTEANLGNWSCSVHNAFDEWPLGFEVVGLALDGDAYTAPGGQVGTPYILARGVQVISDIQLTPESATNEVGTDHTLTAEVIFEDDPVEGTEVTFSVIDGPHDGTTGTATTNSSGIATFSYTGTDLGTDTIEATFTDPDGASQRSNRVNKRWVEEGDEPDEPEVPDDRVSGSGRTETSVEMSKLFDSADSVVLARADDYPDSLAGAPLATQLEAPILLTARDGLSAPVADEIQRLGASHAVLLGGEAALTPGVVSDLQSQGITDIDRYGGAHRFETAALIADEVVDLAGPPAATRPGAYVVEGQNADPARGWPDAVGVSGLAAFEGTPILLAVTDDATPATRDAIADLGIDQIRIVGGTGAVSNQVRDQLSAEGASVDRIFGPNRYATSAALAEDAAVNAAMSPNVTYLATGGNWPDSLSAAPVAGSTAANLGVQGGVLLLVDGRDLDFSAASRDWLESRAADITQVTAVGGTGAISNAVLTEAQDLVE